MIEFPVGEGTASAYLALPRSGEGPGILLLHAWWGLTSFFKETCERLAQEGFVVLAPDLYHGTTAATIDEAKQAHSALSLERARQDVTAAVAALLRHPAVQGNSIGCIGFSMGAAWSLYASELLPDQIAAVVVFYGAWPEVDFAAAKAAYLGHFAEHDEWEPDEGVAQTKQAIQNAGREVTFHTYPETTHWFFEANRPDAYHDASARLAWERTLAFLRSHLGSSGA